MHQNLRDACTRTHQVATDRRFPSHHFHLTRCTIISLDLSNPCISWSPPQIQSCCSRPDSTWLRPSVVHFPTILLHLATLLPPKAAALGQSTSTGNHQIHHPPMVSVSITITSILSLSSKPALHQTTNEYINLEPDSNYEHQSCPSPQLHDHSRPFSPKAATPGHPTPCSNHQVHLQRGVRGGREGEWAVGCAPLGHPSEVFIDSTLRRCKYIAEIPPNISI